MLLMGVSSFATNTRVLTMGDNNTILLDEANIWQFPSRINDYPNFVIGEFGAFSHEYYSDESSSSDDFTELGIHWRFNEDNPWVLGTYLHNSDVIHPITSPLRSYYGFPYGYNLQFVPFNEFTLRSNQRIDLFYGRLLGANQIPFGCRLSLVHSSQRYDVPANMDEEKFAIYDLSAGWTVPGPQVDITVGFELMTWTDKATSIADSTVWDESKPKGNYMLYAAIRRFCQPSPPWTVVPHAAIYIGKNEAEYYELNPPFTGTDSLAQTDKYNWFGFELGSGLQYTPSNDAMAVIDFGLRYDKVEGDFTNTAFAARDGSSKTITVPFFKAGADLKVFNWMDLRLGATSYWNKHTIESDFPSKLIRNYAQNATYLGFGFHWGDLHVDTYTDPNLFLKGFNFISGETNSMNFQISAIYELM